MNQLLKAVQAAALAWCDELKLTNVPFFALEDFSQRAYVRQTLRRAVGQWLGRARG